MKYIKGLYIKSPSDKAPEFVLAKGSINTQKLKEQLDEITDEWINFDILKSKKGEVYMKIDDGSWKKQKTENQAVEYDEDIDIDNIF